MVTWTEIDDITQDTADIDEGLAIRLKDLMIRLFRKGIEGAA